MQQNILVLDANILIRAVLGHRVRELLVSFSDSVEFFIPDVCMEDVQKYLPIIFNKRSMPHELGLEVLSNLKCLLHIVDETIYQEYAVEAQKRIVRDLADWPVIATALTFDCPIWTEDQDFFGSGIPVWTTDRIHIFLNQHKTIAD